MRIIAHVDMDAFYAAVEERNHPELRGRPIVVGADPKGGAGRGVVTAASYAARKYGIRSALPISRAWRLAEAARRRGEPEAVFVRDDRAAYREASEGIMRLIAEGADAFEAASIDEAYVDLSSLETLDRAVYREVSDRIMALIADGADAFEEASIDEAYVDLSSLGELARAEAHARALKARILDREGLTCSVGIGPNKLVAKIASDFRKPDGLTVIGPDDVAAFLGGLRIRVIPGIGPKTEAFLHERQITTVAELCAVEPDRLGEWFGKLGLDLYRKARGVSDDPVSNEWERKSVGEQETFEEDSLDPAFILGRARELAGEVFRRFVADGFQGFQTVTITVRFSGFMTVSRSRTSKPPRRSGEELDAEVARLLEPFFDARENPKGKKIRLIGVRVEKLSRDA